MTPLLAMRRIILPQAIRVVIPAFGNCLIGPFKEASLCSVITIQAVMFRAEMSAARNYQHFTRYTIIAAMYRAVRFPAAARETKIRIPAAPAAIGRWAVGRFPALLRAALDGTGWFRCTLVVVLKGDDHAAT